MTSWLSTLILLGSSLLLAAYAIKTMLPKLPFRSALIAVFYLFASAGGILMAWRLG